MGEFDQTLGFTLMGVTINTYLTGVIMSQFFTYWTSNYQDPLWLRSLIPFLFIINATQAAAVVYMLWFYCVTNFTNPDAVAVLLWPYPFTALTMSILALVNHTFQSWRIYRFTDSKILAAFLLVISLANCGIGVAVSMEMWTFSKLSELVALQPIIEGNLALQCAVDAIIAVIMTVVLSRWRTHFFADMDKVLNRLIRTAVQSGFFTAVFALGTLLSSRFSPKTYMVSLFSLPIGRIYTHTMMDQLVTREELRGMFLNRGNHLSFPILSDFNVAPSGTARMEAMMMHTLSTASKEVRNESSNDVSKES
ncbi:hypothetical protein DFH08DRAFT_419492 [Mycena albidolilacea]|uniref:DUF6534 domain-containing protein n=1 Tax=Mycena albidolilacea TaxID=1033008 RepID=A0AAD6ZDC4_9AGAR|nr:hypothetical protein DFH08DRAFT_419492 [Mycena albidolilacea]